MALGSCTELIQEFSTRTTVPVELDDVVEALLGRGVKDEIYYFNVPMDTDVLLGALEEWEYPTPDGQIKYVAHVDCAKSLSGDWRRLVTCKELLHLLDPPGARVKTAEEFERLISKIGLPPEDQDPAGEDWQTVNDRVGTYKALAVLFPWAARELLMPKYVDGTLSHEDIAKIVDIPPRYAALALREDWANVHKIFIGQHQKK